MDEALVSTEWLAERLPAGRPDDPVIVDLRWREDGSGHERYRAGHVPGAVFCDWTTDMVDPDHRFAFMLAPPERFAALMSSLRIGDETEVVAYADQEGSGPFRLRWACRVYGHDHVRILDGGLERWLAEGRPIETGDGPARPRDGLGSWTPATAPASAVGSRSLVATADDVARAEGDPSIIVLDSRPAFQFRGEGVWFETGPVAADAGGVAHTPRGSLRAGHVPWARNIPSATLYRADGRLKEPRELREMFERAGVSKEARVVTYCGVGISASALLFALEHAGIHDVALYDASWEEWGRDPDRPVAR